MSPTTPPTNTSAENSANFLELEAIAPRGRRTGSRSGRPTASTRSRSRRTSPAESGRTAISSTERADERPRCWSVVSSAQFFIGHLRVVGRPVPVVEHPGERPQQADGAEDEEGQPPVPQRDQPGHRQRGDGVADPGEGVRDALTERPSFQPAATWPSRWWRWGRMLPPESESEAGGEESRPSPTAKPVHKVASAHISPTMKRTFPWTELVAEYAAEDLEERVRDREGGQRKAQLGVC